MTITDFLERFSKFEVPNCDEYLEELSKPFWEALEKESDRAIAVIATCVLDNQLEKLILASYIKDPHVKSIFKDDHILQTFFAKINIAYFSGLIPEAIFLDLKLIGEIRNRFAHEITENLTFSSGNIVNKIDHLALRPRTVDELFAPKLKYIIVIQLLVALLGNWEQLLIKIRPPNLVEIFKLNDTQFNEMALTKQEIIDVIKKEGVKIKPDK